MESEHSHLTSVSRIKIFLTIHVDDLVTVLSYERILEIAFNLISVQIILNLAKYTNNMSDIIHSFKKNLELQKRPDLYDRENSVLDGRYLNEYCVPV